MPGFYWTYIESEAPTIGTGWRLVYVHSIGRRWVRIRAVATLQAARIKRKDWDRGNQRRRSVGRPKNLNARVTRRLRETGQVRTKAIAEMLQRQRQAMPFEATPYGDQYVIPGAERVAADGQLHLC